MHLDWLLGSTPENSRAANGSDTRNISLAGNCFKPLRRTPCYGRNARFSSTAIFSMQDLMTEVLPSTSASIVKAGLNKVWQTELKASPYGRPSEPGFRVPSLPHQKVLNAKQPEQGVIHTPTLEPVTAQPAAAPIPINHLPYPKVRQPDSELPTPKPSTSVVLHHLEPVETFVRIQQPKLAPILTFSLPRASQSEQDPDPQHPSGSRFLPFSLQEAANKEPDPDPSIVQALNSVASKMSSSFQQHIAAPLLSLNAHGPKFNSNDISSNKNVIFLGSSAANGSESTQRNIALNLFSAVPSVSPPLYNLLPNTSPPAQSLLFLPPKEKFIFNPFSPGEDTVPLPPIPEPTSSQFGITYPAQSPHHKFLIHTLPNPPLFPTGNVYSPVPVLSMIKKSQGHTVPYSTLSPIQDFDIPSPLSIDLLLPPWQAASPPPELIIKIAGPEGYLNADHYKPQVTHFLLSRATEVANSLVIVWQLSHVDSGGARGLVSLKALFAQLDEKVLDSDRTALSSFSRLSITIPDLVKDIAPYNDLLRPIEEDNTIDLANAVDLLEFTWHGDFVIFASKFKNLSFTTLTCLIMKSSDISIEDAVTLLHSCSDLQTVTLGTIRSEEDSDAVTSLKSSGVKQKALPKLIRLALESDVALHPLIGRILWTTGVSLTLTLRKKGSTNIHKLPLLWRVFSSIELNCHLTPQELSKVKKAFPPVQYHEMDE